jgi:cell wall-associated NlpC family hydrolase
MVAYCSLSHIPVRSQPSHSSEQISELIYGEWVEILNKEEDWSEIRTEHNYKGFARTRQLKINPFPRIEKLCIGKSNFGHETNLGEKFSLLSGSIYTYPLPVNQFNVSEEFLKNITNPPTFSLQELAQNSYNLLNTPYIWGGKTVNGFDCSGLIQFLIQKQGYSFPRDAWQQAMIGEKVEIQYEEYPYHKGDLLFFQHPGKPIHHVAISLGYDLYVHASEWVQINSLDPTSHLFVQERKDTLVFAKRLRSADLTSLIESFRRMIA